MDNAPKLLLNRRQLEDFRRLRASVLSLAEQGRMTLELLRDLSFQLLDFTGAWAVEIAVAHTDRVFHGDARSQNRPRFFCETRTQTDPLSEDVLRGLRLLSVKSPAREEIEDRLKRPHQGDPLVQRWKENETDDSGQEILGLLIPRGDTLCGIVLLAFDETIRIHEAQQAGLEDLAQLLGLALSHNKSRFDLRERVKELTCMYGLANEAARRHHQVGPMLERIVRLLPPAWLYPEITEACIVLDGQVYATSGFHERGASLVSEIVVNGEVRGTVEVRYLESRAELDEGPFLMEERKLLDSVAHEVALILERRQAEREQTRLEEQLRHAERLATLGRLAAGVAHELNEPLTGILGFAELLQDGEEFSDQAGQDLNRIRTAALHARDVVRKLLLFARQVPTKRSQVDLKQVLQDALSLVEVRLRKKGIVLHQDIAEEEMRLTADESQLRQVAMNLLINAEQAMPHGGRLVLSLRDEGETLCLEVRDTGLGMTGEVQEKIFLPFFTTKDIHQGTGLGLSVVHGIIKGHGGRIQVESAPGRGSRFRIHLPKEPVKHEC